MSFVTRTTVVLVSASLGLITAGTAVAAPAPTVTPVVAVSQAAPARPAAPAARPTLKPGARGPAVVALQTRLTELGYWVGAADGSYGHATAQGVMAVQKVAGLGRDGIAGPATWRALDAGVRPTPRSTKGRVLEIDLSRQVMTFVVDGKIRWIVNTSTGTAADPTPTGTYRFFRQIDRWHTAPLGKLYRPKYFHRGYAVHGVTDGNIPARPASHGCARVSTAAMDMMWGRNGLRYNDVVLVY
ncbi:MAG: L,D-transpeptidase family protein [Mobilicoccus sp.]|nr:L,D-transpeptidase family protein [Mobilicoccus sp.]